MNLSEIASISGKGGLFKIVKPTRTGVILESLDDKKSKIVANTSHRVSVLEDISIYTTTQEGAVPLAMVFKKIYEEFETDPGLDSTSSNEELKSFMKHILPDFDKDKVYVSDIKRLVSWYNILVKESPETLANAGTEEKEEEKSDK